MRNLIRLLARKKILNNIVFNNFLIWLRLDKKFADYIHYYSDFKIDKTQSLQEIAGYSIHPEVNEVLTKIHEKLENVTTTYLKKGDHVLDIGCGPGLYLKDISEDFKTFGIDITAGMIECAKEVSPKSEFYLGDFIDTQIKEKFKLIQTIGLLIYINRSNIEVFFNKINDLLETEGVVFISYPHATSRKDLYYPDINYTQYSPILLEKIASKKFNILYHRHIMDDKVVGKFDSNRYLHPLNPTSRYYKNSSILILQKKVV